LSGSDAATVVATWPTAGEDAATTAAMPPSAGGDAATCDAKGAASAEQGHWGILTRTRKVELSPPGRLPRLCQGGRYYASSLSTSG
jgi:hypothetical protein